MENNNSKTRIAAVGDIHVRETDKGKWVEYFRKISEKADILLLCGDLTYSGHESEALVLADELKSCTIPVVAILGNHDYERDQQDAICKVISREILCLLDGGSITIGNIGIAGVKGFGGGFDRYMLPMYGEKMNKMYVQESVNESLKLDQALVRLGNKSEIKKIAILHYAPIKDTLIGEPEEIIPFLGSSYLEEPLNRRQVVAAFHGHAHLGTFKSETSKGVKVFNVAKALLERDGFEDEVFIFEV